LLFMHLGVQLEKDHFCQHFSQSISFSANSRVKQFKNLMLWEICGVFWLSIKTFVVHAFRGRLVRVVCVRVCNHKKRRKCRKCRHNVYRRSITLSLPLFLTATYIWLKTHHSLRAISHVLVTSCILLNSLNRF
jgi:hypothetical protein